MERPRRVGIERLVENQMNRWNVEARLRHSESDDSTVEEGIKPYIAISRLRGSHGNELGRILAERLGYKLYDRELVDYVAERANVRAEAVAALGETWYNKTHDWIAGTIDKRFLRCDEYVRHLAEAVTTIALHDASVFLGRAVGFILPPERGLRLRVVAPFEHRLRRMMELHDMSLAEATRTLHQSDEAKRSFIQAYFCVDMCDPLAYDLCLNFGTLTVEQAVEICLVAFKEKLDPIAAPATARGG